MLRPLAAFFTRRHSHLPRSSSSLFPLRAFASPPPSGTTPNEELQKVEYVHPLSQLVLEHLQTTRSEWIQHRGLDRGLKVQRDGTFVLKFPTYDEDRARIWTSYDPEEKKHWLTVHRGDLVGRYLLQDNTKPAWHDGRSTPEKIQNAVDAMIEKIDQQQPQE